MSTPVNGPGPEGQPENHQPQNGYPHQGGQPYGQQGYYQEPPKKKRVVRKKDVPFVWASTSLDPSVLEQYKQQEAEMHAADKLVMDTEVSLSFQRLQVQSSHR